MARDLTLVETHRAAARVALEDELRDAGHICAVTHPASFVASRDLDYHSVCWVKGAAVDVLLTEDMHSDYGGGTGRLRAIVYSESYPEVRKRQHPEGKHGLVYRAIAGSVEHVADEVKARSAEQEEKAALARSAERLVVGLNPVPGVSTAIDDDGALWLRVRVVPGQPVSLGALAYLRAVLDRADELARR